MIKGLSRRMMLQASAAAPVAMQASTASGSGIPIGPPTSPYPWLGMGEKFASERVGAPIDRAAYLRDRAHNLRTALDGGPDDQDLIEQNYSTHHLVQEHYNSLRSLSPVRRARLAHDAGFAQSRARIRQLRLLELRQVMKQLAGL